MTFQACFLTFGLQMTDDDLDERITALEENGGNPQNGKLKLEIEMFCISETLIKF